MILLSSLAVGIMVLKFHNSLIYPVLKMEMCDSEHMFSNVNQFKYLYTVQLNHQLTTAADVSESRTELSNMHKHNTDYIYNGKM
jgi:hypothetical protein